MNYTHVLEILEFLKEQTIDHPMSEWEECGCCGAYHPKNFTGDCRDDSRRCPTPNPFDYLIEEIQLEDTQTIRRNP